MNKVLKCTLSMAVLLNMSVATAGGVATGKGREVIEDVLKKRGNIVTTDFNQETSKKLDRALIDAGLGEQVAAINKNNFGVTVRAYGRSLKILRETNVDSAEAAAYKKGLEEVLQTYFENAGIILGKVTGSNTPAEQAAILLLKQGTEIAQGKFELNEAKSFSDKIQLIVEGVKSGKSLDQSVRDALKTYGDVDAKIREILEKCKV